MAQRGHFSLRLTAEIRRELERQASERRQSKTHLAELYLEEAVRAARHPGVVFRDGPAGRRPGLAGGPDVWEVVEVFLAHDRDAAATAATLALPMVLVHAALGYYADNQSEVEAWIETNRQLSEEAEAPWRRSHAIASA
jgi:hypothetical protein